MIKKIKGLDINYIDYGNVHGEAIVFLHGWGQLIDMMKPLADPFSHDYRIIIMDLPGHGLSSEPLSVWTISDYVECIKELLDELNINNPVLVGHSFGGKISLMYASKYKVNKLVVLASPYKKKITKLSLKTRTLKKLKQVPGLNKLEGFAKKHIGSTDYKNASPIMRQILVEHVNLDITDIVSNIECPTLIIWGTMDTEVPVEDAYELEKLIKNAGVVIYEGCTHYAYLERIEQTINVLRAFLES